MRNPKAPGLGLSRWTLGIALAWVLAAAPGVASGASVALNAVADTTIYSDNTSNSNGAGPDLYAGKTSSSTTPDFALRRSLIRFDLSSIPAGSTITAVSLRLTLNKTNSGSLPVRLHRVTSQWGEGATNGATGLGSPSAVGDSTWLRRIFNTTSWTTAGGDFVASASATTNVNANANYTWSGATMVSDCQGWLNNSATNFGWIIRGDETTNGSVKRFSSRTNPTVNQRPLLTVTYTPPPASGACCQPDGTCQVMTSAACTTAGGTYQGNGTDCTPNPCPQPSGACCANNGSCTFVTAVDCASVGGTFQGGLVSCASVTCPVILTPFQDALPIPAVATPNVGIPPNTYDMYIREFNHSFHASLPTTRVWGYNSQYPGPTFEVRRGQPIHVTWHNDLRTTLNVLRNTHFLITDQCLHGPDVTGRAPVTVTHLHGLKTDPISDGAPDGTFAPGFSSVQYDYPNDQQAATLWYHDHALGLTRLNVMMGLAGAYLIRDDNEDSLNLPKGEYEIPLIIQDRTFKFGGGIVYNTTTQDNFFGDTICVNGKAWPFLNVKKGKYRFRIVNGSNTRTYTLGLRTAVGAPINFQQIGSDGGFLNAPVTLGSITIMPGERADVVIDFAPFAATSFLTMINTAPAPFPTGDPNNAIPNVMQFRIGAAAGDTDPLPAVLNTIAPIPEAQSTGTKQFVLRTSANQVCNADTWLINDLFWNDVTDFLRVGQTQVWSFVNRSALTHPMHIHLVQFQVLDRQDFTVINNVITPTPGTLAIPPLEERGWKDTVQCPPSKITRVIAKFDGYYGLFPMHCHILEHEDHEMMRQFEVLCDSPAQVGVVPNATVAENQTVQLSVIATGDALTYQWRKNNVNISDGPGPSGSTIGGATTPTLTITNADWNDNGQYDCRITNPCGHPLTNKATVIVTPACKGDLNFDGVVNVLDLTIFLGQFGTVVVPGTGGDLNADGSVNVLDLTIFLGRFGQPCAP
jgi:spore coat protein A